MKTIDDPVAKSELLERLQKVTPTAARKWGKMTIQQMVCHLDDGLQMLMGKRKAANVSNGLSRTVIKYVALHTPLPWPHGANAPKEINQETGAGTRPDVLEQDLARLRSSIDEFCRTPRTYQVADHPMFGPMTEWECMRLGYAHIDHHLRQFGL